MVKTLEKSELPGFGHEGGHDDPRWFLGLAKDLTEVNFAITGSQLIESLYEMDRGCRDQEDGAVLSK